VISGFRREEDEDCFLSHFKTEISGNFLPHFRNKLSISALRAKNFIECSSSESEKGYMIGFLALQEGPIICPETSVINYHYSLRNKPLERSSQFH